MDFFESKYFTLCRFFMLLIGQWPYDQSKFKVFSRSVMLLTFILYINTQISKLLIWELNLDLFLEVFTPLLITIMCLTKYCIAWFQYETIRELLEHIKYDWYTIKVKEELDILEANAEEGKFLVMFYMALIYGGLCIYIIGQCTPDILDLIIPLNESRSRYILFVGEYFVNQQEYFYPIMIHVLFTIILVLTAAAASDFIFIHIVLHACAIYKVLGYRLEHMFDDATEVNKKPCNERGKCLFCGRIARLVKFHRKTMKYVGIINSCYTFALITQLVLTVSIMSSILLRMFETLTTMRNVMELIICTIHVSGFALLVFVNILPTQMLLDCSTDIFYKTYYASWYEAPLRVQKLLLPIMQKCMVPCGLTAANILTSSLETFARIIQVSLSYFTVLYSVRQ